jgi:outer membrane protein W
LILLICSTTTGGVELIAGISEHQVSFENSTGAAIAGLSDGQSLFDAWVLPPTLTLQYHFLPENNIRPYVGVGVNYTAMLWANATSSVEAILARQVLAFPIHLALPDKLVSTWIFGFGLGYHF